jgi:hypothetical protein
VAPFPSLYAIELCSDAGPGLATIHLGVGMAGGAQCIGHALRAGAAAYADHVTCDTNCHNSFNTNPRGAVLAAVAERHPQLFPFVRLAYSCPAELWVHGGPRGHELCGPPLVSDRVTLLGLSCLLWVCRDHLKTL